MHEKVAVPFFIMANAHEEGMPRLFDEGISFAMRLVDFFHRSNIFEE